MLSMQLITDDVNLVFRYNTKIIIHKIKIDKLHLIKAKKYFALGKTVGIIKTRHKLVENICKTLI